jgi:hypothetical protein
MELVRLHEKLLRYIVGVFAYLSMTPPFPVEISLLYPGEDNCRYMIFFFFSP